MAFITPIELFMRIAKPFGGAFETIFHAPHLLSRSTPHVGLDRAETVAPSSTQALAAAWQDLNGRDPIILVQGYCSIPHYLEPLRRTLQTDGHTVYIFDMPNNGLGDAREAAIQLAQFAEQVRAKHGGKKVQFMGHSRGGLIARDAAVHYLAPGSVSTVMTIASPNNGAKPQPLMRRLLTSAIGHLFLFPSSLDQLLTGSDYIRGLDDRNLAREGVRLVSIFSNRYDGAVNSNEAYMPVPGWINREVDPKARWPHLTIVYDPRIYPTIREALEKAKRQS